VLPCALAKYPVNRMAYDESTAWFRVQHCLKPLRPFINKKKKKKIGKKKTNCECNRCDKFLSGLTYSKVQCKERMSNSADNVNGYLVR